jgi:tetratricopeptide (TPR) repeat protein
MLLAGCAGAGGESQLAADLPLAAAAALPPDAVPTTPLGAYLSGRVAEEEHDLPAALAFFEDALAHDPGNPELITHLFILSVTEGRFDIAAPLAKTLAKADPKGALPNLVAAVDLTHDGKPADALEHAKQLPDVSLYHFVGRLTRAWLLTATKALPATAMAELDGLESAETLGTLKALHEALITDLDGDTTAAGPLYDKALAGGKPPLRLVQLAGNFFERAGQRDKAVALYQSYAADGYDAGLAPTAAPAGQMPLRLVPDAKAGLAEALFDIASLVNQADSPDVALLNIRLALRLEPAFPLARLVLGDILEATRRWDEAASLYRSFDPKSPYNWTARLRLAMVMVAQHQDDAARAALQAMAAERPTAPEPLIELGDALRSREQYAAAAAAYGEALQRVGSDPPARYWSLFYTRGTAFERAGDWPPAETDLRKALSLKPDEPEVLNYLGYAMVDRNEHLSEALDLIRRAVELKPNDGYFVDSLGWAYFRKGDFGEAQKTLEHAVELKPGDAAINDHLGDAYWQSGRADEARLQWRRALSLNPDPDLAKTIGAKLDHPPAVKHAAATRHGG